MARQIDIPELEQFVKTTSANRILGYRGRFQSEQMLRAKYLENARYIVVDGVHYWHIGDLRRIAAERKG